MYNLNVRGISLVVERDLPKVKAPVRFWYPAPEQALQLRRTGKVDQLSGELADLLII